MEDGKEVNEAAKMQEDDKSEVVRDFFMSESEASSVKKADKEDLEADAESAAPNPLENEAAPEDFPDAQEIAASDEKKGVDWPEKAAALKNFVKDRGIIVGKVLRRLSAKKDDLDQVSELTINEEAPPKDGGEKKRWPSLSFLKFNPSNELEFVSKATAEFEESLNLSGRITLFTKSGCAESKLIRHFLRQNRLPFAEINLDLFPQRGLDLEERTGTSSVPQVFFNEELIGGMDELSALQKSGELAAKIRKVSETPCPENAPGLPATDDEDGESPVSDEFAGVVRQLREKMLLKDRYYSFRVFNKCFPGSDAVEVFSEDQYCEKEEAVEFGRKVGAKHFFHHVLNENIFEDGNGLYRFLEHDPVVATKCLNFFGSTNDAEPKPASEVCRRLTKLMQAIFDRYVSLDGSRVDYFAVSASDEFKRYVKLTEELQRIDLSTLSREEKVSFFLNIHNGMMIHSFILYGRPNGAMERRIFFGEIQYVIGGYAYSLSAIENGILRANLRPPYNITKVFGGKDPRLQMALPEPEPLVHFALSYGTRSSPALRCYSPEAVDTELRMAARDFFDKGGIKIDSEARTVYLSKMMKWFSVDFGKSEREVLHWIAKHIDPTKAEHLLNLMEDYAQVKVNYLPFDWSPNV